MIHVDPREKRSRFGRGSLKTHAAATRPDRLPYATPPHNRLGPALGTGSMIATNVRRPRNVDVPRAAAILYGDWGTSKAYVIGLAFAVAGYASFWLIAAMCFLTALVGIN